jgi:energy-coupling factor transporter ATP-binding protein EcfA2
MRITKIACRNFKSLVDFEAPLAKFTCLVGLNGSGKSTVLQFVDFLSQLMRGDIAQWLAEREWAAGDLASWREAPGPIAYAVDVADDSGAGAGRWEGQFNPATLRCETESLTLGGTRFVVADNTFSASHTDKSYDITLEYQGSLLARIRDQFLPAPIARLRDFFRDARTLELLSPRLMRQRTRGRADAVGRGGERLAAYLYDLPEPVRGAITERLKAAYPNFHSLHPVTDRSGRRIEVEEDYEGRRLRTESRHVNDGLLRTLAVVTNLVSRAPLLVFDEIENGVNPELVQFVVRSLLDAEAQVLVTTHSPMILNYLPDAEARAGVVYLYRTKDGRAKAVRLFDIPSMREKLRVMGPGEAFVDTNLVELADEITAAPEPA